MDQEAFLRGTSVYLPGRVLPMLPERLSNGVCSLRPGEDRLVLSVLVDLTEDLKVKRVRFREGVIRSVARLTYTEVEAFAEGFGLPEEHAFLAEDLRLLLDLTQRMREKRLKEGALDFAFPEVKVEVGEEGELHLIPQAEPKARSLIEELMLLANRLVAEYLVQKGLPGLFRVHEEPVQDAYEKLRQALARLGYTLPPSFPATPCKRPSSPRGAARRSPWWPTSSSAPCAWPATPRRTWATSASPWSTTCTSRAPSAATRTWWSTGC